MALSDFLSGVEQSTKLLSNLVYPPPPPDPVQGLKGAPVSLGDYDFVGFNAPDSMSYGTTQNYSILTKSGGARIVNAHGAEKQNITWAGILLGPTSQDDSRRLEQFAEDGEQRTLCWGQYDYEVLVGKASFRQIRPFHYHYEFECVVLTQNAANSQPGLTQLTNLDLASAVAATPAAQPGILGALQSVQGAVKQVQSVIQIGAQVVTQVNDVKNVIESQISAANDAIRLVGNLGSVPLSVNDTVQALTQVSNSFGTLTSFVPVSSITSRIVSNVSKGLGQ